MTDLNTELLALNQKLLDSIKRTDWKTYESLSAPSITALEPEANGQCVDGLAFHKFYFDLGGAEGPYNITMGSPHVRVVGDIAILSYVRLDQKLDATNAPVTKSTEETRVWQRFEKSWQQVHVHRSPL